jgi:tyrosine-protein kinase Etk/Wzc
VLIAAAYVVLTPPTFRADVLLQVEDRGRGFAGLEEVASALTDKSLGETEIEIIRSRTLLGSVVDQLNLALSASPRALPIVGNVLSRHHRDGLAAPLPGLARYAWGGERIRLQRLELPDDLLNRRLRLVAEEGRRFRIVGPDGETLVTGEVGKASRADREGRRVEAFVAELVARPGTEFDLVRRGRDDVIRDLQRRLQVSERVKKTGILVVALDGEDPHTVAAIVDGVAQAYQRQNVERKSLEAVKSLEFIQEQLPVLKANLDAAEGELRSHQLEHGTVDLSLETQALLERAAQVEESASSLELTRRDLRSRYAEEHPLLQSLRGKIAQLHGERAAIEEKMQRLPQQEATQARLSRNLKVATELYFTLLNKAQELNVAKSAAIGNVRILDTAARPERVGPKNVLILGSALLLGLLLGVTIVLTKDSLEQSLEDPEEIERIAGIGVYANVPHSGREAALARRRRSSRWFSVLATADSSDPAVESLRSLRTGLQFALANAGKRVIAIGGPSPGAGKSFVSANLAHVFAQAGERVLLVDGDLRRGQLHRYYSLDRSPGLSEVLSGQCSLMDASRPVEGANLHFVSTGKLPPNPAELLGSERFGLFVEAAAADYDVVVIDTPPILAVADAALIARLAGVNLVVIRAGRNTRRELVQSLKRSAWGGAKVHGLVLNDVPCNGAGRGYSYQYEYRTDREES